MAVLPTETRWLLLEWPTIIFESPILLLWRSCKRVSLQLKNFLLTILSTLKLNEMFKNLLKCWQRHKAWEMRTESVEFNRLVWEWDCHVRTLCSSINPVETRRGILFIDTFLVGNCTDLREWDAMNTHTMLWHNHNLISGSRCWQKT